jgi:hypothetical protein
MISIYDMQFEKVMELYVQLMKIEENNDIKARTLFREEYPEMFDPVIFKEVEEAYKRMNKYVNKKAKWNNNFYGKQ